MGLRRRILYGLLMLCTISACNLVSDDEFRQTETALTPTAAALPTDLPIDVLPTDSGALVPNIVLTPLSPASRTVTPAIAVPIPGGTRTCEVYTVYSGTNPENTLSLRQSPSVNGLQLLRLPNFATVYRIPDAGEVEADGYHWLNLIYIDALQNRSEGWAARDSFEQGGVRDLSVATLRATGQQAAC